MAGHSPKQEGTADLCATILNDGYVRNQLEHARKYALGSYNESRYIRDVDAALPMYLELGVTVWSYLALLLKALLVALNATAIIYAWATYKSAKPQQWHFEKASRVVVWMEFLGVCYFGAWLLWSLLRLLAAAVREARSPADEVFAHKLEVCSRLRAWYKAGVRLQFNLLSLLRFISPAAVATALERARRKVYGRYGTRNHRNNCCADAVCCAAFYGRLVLCSVGHYALVLLCAGLAIMAVLLKVLQLRFLGEVNIRHWTATEILLFGQFVINLLSLDTRERSKKRAKLSLLFDGADANEAEGEHKAKHTFETLALLLVRCRYGWLTALVMHHSLTSDDISFLFIHDRVEADKPRNHVRHQAYQGDAAQAAHDTTHGGADPEAGGGWHAAPPRPGQQARARHDVPMQSYDNPEWMHHDRADVPGYGPYDQHGYGKGVQHPVGVAGYGMSGGGAPREHPLYPGQVIVQISPRKRGNAGPSGGGAAGRSPPQQRDQMGPAQLAPAAPGRMEAAYGAGQRQGVGQRPEGPVGRGFPYDFYDNGVAGGAQAHGWGRPASLKDRYEQVLWGAQGGQ